MPADLLKREGLIRGRTTSFWGWNAELEQRDRRWSSDWESVERSIVVRDSTVTTSFLEGGGVLFIVSGFSECVCVCVFIFYKGEANGSE